MKLPPLWIIVSSQALIWCIAGAYVHSWKILLYPLSWVVVGAAFYLHNKRNPILTGPSPELSSGPFANSKNSTGTKSEKVGA